MTIRSDGGAPLATTGVSVTTLAAATPASRDRFVDLVRLTAIAVVAGGHWVMTLLLVAGDTTLSQHPALRFSTWLLQVMPLFFLVGGFSHAVALRSAARRGGTYAEFLHGRAARLLAPIMVFVGVWTVLAAGLQVTGLASGQVATALDRAATPLWFLGVYLLVVVTAPLTHAWHRRHGAAVPVLLGLGAVAVDLLAYGLGRPELGALNLALVWGAIHQLGYLYADGTLTRRGVPAAMLLGGLAATLTLTVGSGAYPVLMVGLPGSPTSNMAPPTFALLTHAVWITGLALLLRPALVRWLRRPRVWTAVIAGNSVIMTVFCWHLTAGFLVHGALLLIGFRLPVAGSAAWWALLPVYLAACTLALVLLVALFRRAEAPPRPAAPRPAGERPAALVGVAVPALVGVAATAVGLFALSQIGWDGLLDGTTQPVLGVPVTALSVLVLVAAGRLLLLPRRG